MHFSFPEYKSSLLTALFVNVILHFFRVQIITKELMKLYFLCSICRLNFLFSTTKKLLSLTPRSLSSACSVLAASMFCAQCTHLIGSVKALLEILPQNLVCSLRKTCWTTSPSCSPGNPDMFMDFYSEILTERYLRSFPTFPFQKTVQRT